MNVFVTFDYELYFGAQTGTAEACIIHPTQELLKLADKYQVKFTFFVDVLYLIRLESLSNDPQLNKDLTAIKEQLQVLVANGHDVQLQLHTHWINASYDGSWHLDYKNYRIHNFEEDETEKIVSGAVDFLENLTQQKVFAFRAGGWCIQPFDKLKQAFLKKNIWLDSTVFYKGYNETENNLYDFRNAPDGDIWNFNHDPLQINEAGAFTELPISYCRVFPWFYWKSLLSKKLYPKRHLPAGNGKGIKKDKRYLLRLLFQPSYSAISCDGYKSTLLQQNLRSYAKAGKKHFVIIGHPKLLTQDALKHLESLIYTGISQGHTFPTLTNVFNTRAIVTSP